MGHLRSIRGDRSLYPRGGRLHDRGRRLASADDGKLDSTGKRKIHRWQERRVERRKRGGRVDDNLHDRRNDDRGSRFHRLHDVSCLHGHRDVRHRICRRCG
jgi:hypothetical protein